MESTFFRHHHTRAKLFYQRLERHLTGESLTLQAEYALSDDPVPYAKRLGLSYRTIGEGESWAKAWQNGWFHLTGTVPDKFAGKTLAYRLDFCGEAMIFDDAGVPYVNLSSSCIFNATLRKEFIVLDHAGCAGEKIDLWIEAAANALYGLGRDQDPDDRMPRPVGNYNPCVNHIKLVVFNQEVRRLRIDVEVLLSCIEIFGEADYRSRRIVRKLCDAVNVFETTYDAKAARAELTGVLGLRALDSALTVTAVGHAHIDVGWLWPVRESIRKAARTFAGALYHIKQYPDYVFGASQPRLFAFVKEHYPELFEHVRRAVAEGRFELQGGMWVEADCNISSGEALVRQFVHGKNFFRDEFGVDVRYAWLPDAFGYAATLPQIMRKAGCDYFHTQKIWWSKFNAFPFHTFNWRGIDGSEVLTHLSPTHNYNAFLLPNELAAAQNRFAEADTQNEFLAAYGLGDGGGGPSFEHIERGLRLRNLEGVPRVQFGKAGEFFGRIAQKYGDTLPRWSGELYLEFHRGTLTSQARTKQGNRRCEQMLQTLEMIASAAGFDQYPAAELDRMWKTLLTNQFHDILPGSSIREVYETAEEEYAQILENAAALMNQSAASIFAQSAESFVAVNTLPFPVEHVVTLPPAWGSCSVVDEKGRAAVCERSSEGVCARISVEAWSFATFRRIDARPEVPRELESLVLENELVSYQFDEIGQLIRAYDKEAGRDVLAGNANELTLHVDYPNQYEAWDIDIHYREMPPEKARAFRAPQHDVSNLLERIHFDLGIGDSTLNMTAELAPGSKKLVFRVTVDWRESRKALRVAFPVDIHATEESFDIPFGFLKRPLNENTSWERAKFEVCAHQYADLSEADYGAALLNDCKYGYAMRDRTLDLCLLRSAKDPDFFADAGIHHFTYAFLPHRGDLVHSEVMAQAAALNREVSCFFGYAANGAAFPVRVEGGNIRIEAFKKAEKEDAYLLRLVESRGSHTSGRLHFAAQAVHCCECDLLEWQKNDLVLEHNQLDFTMKPFEIKSFLFHL